MKYLKTKNIYQASNVYFDANTCQAYSYSWWRFVECFDGKIIFNNYRYSNTTIKHQDKVRWLLRELGLAIHLEIEAPQGLQNLESAVEHYESLIADLKAAIAKPKTKAAKNADRQCQIQHCQQKIADVKALIKAKSKQAA